MLKWFEPSYWSKSTIATLAALGALWGILAIGLISWMSPSSSPLATSAQASATDDRALHAQVMTAVPVAAPPGLREEFVRAVSLTAALANVREHQMFVTGRHHLTRTTPITVVVFLDLGCLFCVSFLSDVLPYADTLSIPVTWVLRHYVNPKDEGNFWRAAAIECAGQLRGASAYFDLYKAYAQGQAHQAIKRIGVSADALERCLNDQRTLQALHADYQAARAIGLRVLPTFVIDGFVVDGSMRNIQQLERFLLARPVLQATPTALR